MLCVYFQYLREVGNRLLGDTPDRLACVFYPNFALKHLAEFRTFFLVSDAALVKRVNVRRRARENLGKLSDRLVPLLLAQGVLPACQRIAVLAGNRLLLWT